MGFGTSPAGNFPFGFGSPEEVPAPPTPTQYSRELDPSTKDYSIDPRTSGFKRTTPTRQRVVLALLTVLTSSTVQPTWGVKRPLKMGLSFEQEVEQSIRSALRQLVEVEQVITIESIVVQRGGGGRSKATVRWVDLTTGQADSQSLALG